MANYIVDKNGTVFYYNLKGEYHREDGPAIEYSYGAQEWWVCGEKHRLYHPAFINNENGHKSYYVGGTIFNLYGPALGEYRYFISNNEITDIQDFLELITDSFENYYRIK